jgi:hypothetical protein
MAPRRRLIASLGLVLTLLTGCASQSVAQLPEDEAVAVPTGRGTREDPPVFGSPGSSGSAASGHTPLPGCPATRKGDEPVAEISEGDIRGAAGIYRACTESEGFEIRVDETTGLLRWYILDSRFVRRPPPGFDGELEILSCADRSCTAAMHTTGEARSPSTFQLSLFRNPLALTFQAPDEVYPREWVRAAD